MTTSPISGIEGDLQRTSLGTAPTTVATYRHGVRVHELADLERTASERWLIQEARGGMSARTRNSYVVSVLAFANWCADDTVGRLLHNPLRGISKADEKAGQTPRASSDDRGRSWCGSWPLRVHARYRKHKLSEKGREGERYADVRPEVRERLTRLGWERR